MIQRLKEIAAFLALTLVLFAILTVVAAFVISPLIARNKTAESFQLIGLNAKILPQPEKNWSSITYKDVALDKEELSTAKTIIVGYNPFSILWSNRLALLSFENVDLFGNWNAENERPISFSGWTPPGNIQVLAKIPTNRLRFDDTQISVLTPEFGGLTLTFDFEGTMNGKNMEFQSHLKSAQKFISFAAGVNGLVADNFSNIDIDVDQGKFEVPEADIRLGRVFGWVSLTSDKSQGQKIMSELNAGGLTLLNMPWQNVTATLEIQDGAIKIFSEAKSIGVEGVELGLNLLKEGAAPAAISGNLHVEQGQTLIDYLAQQETISLPEDELAKIGAEPNLKVEFIYENAPEKKIKYRLGVDETLPYQDIKIP